MCGVVMMGIGPVLLVGMIPPSTLIVLGGRKTVVCSCRGWGRGARVVHDGW